MRSWSQDEKGKQNYRGIGRQYQLYLQQTPNSSRATLSQILRLINILFTHLQNRIGHIQLFSDPLWEERKKKSITSHPQIHVAFQDLQGRLRRRPSTIFHSPAGPSSNKSTRFCPGLLSLPINRFKVYSGGFWNYFLHFAGIVWRISHLSLLYLSSLPAYFSVTFSSFLSPLLSACSRFLSLLWDTHDDQKQLREKRTDFSLYFLVIAHHWGKSGQGLGTSIAYGSSLSSLLSSCSPILARPTWLWQVLPTVGWASPRQSAIKTTSPRHDHRPLRSRQFFSGGFLFPGDSRVCQIDDKTPNQHAGFAP